MQAGSDRYERVVGRHEHHCARASRFFIQVAALKQRVDPAHIAEILERSIAGQTHEFGIGVDQRIAGMDEHGNRQLVDGVGR